MALSEQIEVSEQFEHPNVKLIKVYDKIWGGNVKEDLETKYGVVIDFNTQNEKVLFIKGEGKNHAKTDIKDMTTTQQHGNCSANLAESFQENSNSNSIESAKNPIHSEEAVDAAVIPISSTVERGDMMENGEIPSPSADVTSPTFSTTPKTELTILSWNIDGLDDRDINGRAQGVCEVINSLSPDIIVLQEVVDENLIVLGHACNTKYDFIVYSKLDYYNAILVKKCAEISQKGHRVVRFETEMGRHLLVQELDVQGISVSVLTTHLESLKKGLPLRKKQLQLCFDEIRGSVSSNVILAGDLNVREHEVEALGGLPQGVSDAWEACGSDSKTEFTWDLKLNNNISFGKKIKPRIRFDRMYYSLKDPKTGIKCSSFDLVGKQRLQSNGLSKGLFPSDHFGMFVKFSLPPL